MNDCKELIIIKILSELQERYDINNLEVKAILDKHLSEYTLLSNETSLMATDLPEKIMFFLSLKSLEGLSKKSIERYKDELSMFSRYVIKPVMQIDINDIRRYFAMIQSERSYEKSTINGKMSVLKSFFGTLYKEEMISKDPTIRLKNIKFDAKNLREHLTSEELEILRSACKDTREKVIVEFIYSTGCRVSEVVEAKLSDINWNESSLLVHGKGDKYRTVYFNVKCKLLLQEYIKIRDSKSDFIFVGERVPHDALTKCGIEKLITRIGKRTNITKSISPHVLRHTMATLALQRGMDITMIQQLLGHTNISTTEIYAKVNTRQLQVAYEKYIAA